MVILTFIIVVGFLLFALHFDVVALLPPSHVLLICAFAERDALTSIDSRHPDDLYKNGIQRSSFLPAIDILNKQFRVTDLDSGTGKRSLSLLLTQTRL